MIFSSQIGPSSGSLPGFYAFDDDGKGCNGLTNVDFVMVNVSREHSPNIGKSRPTPGL